MFSCHGWPLHHFAMMIAILSWSHLNYLGVTMHDRGLATRLHELMATLFDLEETRMSGGLTYMLNEYI
jgi:hypothetical protein